MQQMVRLLLQVSYSVIPAAWPMLSPATEIFVIPRIGRGDVDSVMACLKVSRCRPRRLSVSDTLDRWHVLSLLGNIGVKCDLNVAD